MSRLVILGTSYAVPDATHENTYLALEGRGGIILVDCPASPVVRLAQAGLQLEDVTDVILTHFHPDHVAGAPLMLMNMWLTGRTAPLNLFGPAHCIERLRMVMGMFGWSRWPGLFPVDLHSLPEEEAALPLESPDFRIVASPVRHLIPTVGLRLESRGGAVAAYSSDTEPCPAVIRLAQGADALLHDATGLMPGHSTAGQAGEVAHAAGAKSLYLIHYQPRAADGRLVPEAEQTFDGRVVLAEDLMEIPL